MTNTQRLTAIFAAIAIPAVIIYTSIPISMAIPLVAKAVDRFLIHPQNTIITGVVIGLIFASVALMVFSVYSVFKPSRSGQQIEIFELD